MIKSAIELHQLKLMIHLGWTEEERTLPQPVWVDLKVDFLSAPLACESDLLDDTFCYDQLVTYLKNQLDQKHFRLIEHLGQKLYQILKDRLGEHKIRTRLTKQPLITDLTGGVSFSYGDDL